MAADNPFITQFMKDQETAFGAPVDDADYQTRLQNAYGQYGGVQDAQYHLSGQANADNPYTDTMTQDAYLQSIAGAAGNYPTETNGVPTEQYFNLPEGSMQEAAQTGVAPQSLPSMGGTTGMNGPQSTGQPTPPSVTQAWNQPSAPAPTAQQTGLTDSMYGQVQQQGADQSAQSKQLYDMLMSKAQQNPYDVAGNPAIRAQSDAYRANEERAQRSSLNDEAEAQGPYANLGAEKRLATEQLGQRAGAYEAQLVGQEIKAKRDEIQQALQGMAGVLTADQQRNLQRELSLLDNALAQQQMQFGSSQMEQDWMKTQLQNEQFQADLGLRAEDRASYYDALRKGLFRAEE